MAFAVISAARHPLVPLAGASLTRLQDSRHAAGWTVAPPEGAFDTALRRRAFPPDAGSLLPGLLAATRTGLTPAGGHELARDYLNATTSKGVITSRTHAAGHTKVPLGTGSVDELLRLCGPDRARCLPPEGDGPGGFRVSWRRLHNGSVEQLDDDY